MKLLTLTQASQQAKVPVSALSQAITYGQLPTMLRADSGARGYLAHLPRHHVTEEDLEAFAARYRSKAYNAPDFVAHLNHVHQPRRAEKPMSPEELASREARNIVDDRRAAKDLGMTLSEYREVAL